MLLLCGACQSASSCGKKCQASAWGHHKPICKAIQTLSIYFEEPIPEPRLTDAGNGSIFLTPVTPKEKAKAAKINWEEVYCSLPAQWGRNPCIIGHWGPSINHQLARSEKPFFTDKSKQE